MRSKIFRKALITGITGQDGSYLAELLLSKGCEVHGIIRRSSTFNTGRIEHIYIDPHAPDAKLFLYYGDLADSEQIANIIYNISPDEIYHLGAQSHVRVSFDIPEYTSDIAGLGSTRILEAIRRSGKKVRFYQASSSEMFGSSQPPQNEETLFRPRSPYACSKAYAYWMSKNYRDGYGVFACNGILFNHESPRRGETFVTRKIVRAAVNILAGRQKEMYLGNIDSKRDWGYAPEYVEAMYLMMQQKTADDYVIGTGQSHSVREFTEAVFKYIGIEIEWRGRGLKTEGIVRSSSLSIPVKSGDTVVHIDERYFRPTEVEDLVADTAKARKRLSWHPKITFSDLVKIMTDAEMRNIGLKPLGEGDHIIYEKFPDRWWKGD